MMFSNEQELLALQDDPIRFNDEILYPEKVRINDCTTAHAAKRSPE